MTVCNIILRAIESASLQHSFKEKYESSQTNVIAIKLEHVYARFLIESKCAWDCDEDGLRYKEGALMHHRYDNGSWKLYICKNIRNCDHEKIRPEFLQILKDTTQIFLRVIACNWQKCSEEEGCNVIMSKFCITQSNMSNFKVLKNNNMRSTSLRSDLLKHLLEKNGYDEKLYTHSGLNTEYLIGKEQDLLSFLPILEKEALPNPFDQNSFSLSSGTYNNICKKLELFKNTEEFKSLPQNVIINIEELAKSQAFDLQVLNTYRQIIDQAQLEELENNVIDDYIFSFIPTNFLTEALKDVLAQLKNNIKLIHLHTYLIRLQNQMQKSIRTQEHSHIIALSVHKISNLKSLIKVLSQSPEIQNLPHTLSTIIKELLNRYITESYTENAQMSTQVTQMSNEFAEMSIENSQMSIDNT